MAIDRPFLKYVLKCIFLDLIICLLILFIIFFSCKNKPFYVVEFIHLFFFGFWVLCPTYNGVLPT